MILLRIIKTLLIHNTNNRNRIEFLDYMGRDKGVCMHVLDWLAQRQSN